MSPSSQTKKNIGNLSIVILCLIPILIWLFLQPLDTRFTNFFTTLTSIGQILGLEGMVLLSLSFVLNARLDFLEDYFGGLDKIYLSHRNVGAIAFILLLFHPLSLAIRYFPSFRTASNFLLPSGNVAINAGIFALIVMIILLTLTFFIKLGYNNWKFTHKFLGLALVLSIIHFLMIPSDVSRSLILKSYLTLIAVTGLFSFSYKTLLGKSSTGKKIYILEKISKINHDIIEISLKPKTDPLKFKAGQFIFIKFLEKGKLGEQHPFTISSSPNEKELKLAIKMSGDYTNELINLKKGTLAEIEGPYGRFFSTTNKDEIWIAGGIGITPFLSRIRNFKDTKNIDLFYTIRTRKDAAFLDEIEQTSRKYKNLKTYIYYSLETGHLNFQEIKREVGSLKDLDIFICGPQSMISSLKEQFTKDEIPKNNIHSEEFNLK